MAKGFVLTRQQRDTDTGIELIYWLWTAHGARRLVIPDREAVFFVYTADLSRIRHLLADLAGWSLRPLQLNALDRQPVAGLYCRTLGVRRQVIERLQRGQISLMEEDIRPVDRYLMERFVHAGVEVLQRPGAKGPETGHH